MPTITFIDLKPAEAARQAQELAAQGHPEACEALDLYLRWHVVNHLQNRTEGLDELEEALLEASYWADGEDREPWRHLWAYLLELMADAKRQPSRAGDLQAVEGRAAEMLALLVRHPKPLRPSDLSEQMGISLQQVSNLGQKLEAAGLIVRQRGGGRFTWMFPTARGVRLVGMLPETAAQPKELAGEAPELTLWDNEALDAEVEVA